MIFAAKVLPSQPLILKTLRKRGSTFVISNISLSQESKVSSIQFQKGELYLSIDKEQFLIVKLELIRAYSPSLKLQLAKNQKEIKLIAKHGQIHIIGTIEGSPISQSQKITSSLEIKNEKQKPLQIKEEISKEPQVSVIRSSVRIRNAPPPPKYDESKVKAKQKDKKEIRKTGGLLALLQAEADSDDDDDSFSEQQSESSSSQSDQLEIDLEEQKQINRQTKAASKVAEKKNSKNLSESKSENPEVQINAKEVKLQSEKQENQTANLKNEVKSDEKVDKQQKGFPIPKTLPSFYNQSQS